MTSAQAYSQVDLDYLEEEIGKALEEDEGFEEDWLKKLEPDFGHTNEPHLFVQTDTFNAFLYSDRAVMHILNADIEDLVYDVLDEFYDIEDEN